MPNAKFKSHLNGIMACIWSLSSPFRHTDYTWSDFPNICTANSANAFIVFIAVPIISQQRLEVWNKKHNQVHSWLLSTSMTTSRWRLNRYQKQPQPITIANQRQSWRKYRLVGTKDNGKPREIDVISPNNQLLSFVLEPIVFTRGNKRRWSVSQPASQPEDVRKSFGPVDFTYMVVELSKVSSWLKFYVNTPNCEINENFFLEQVPLTGTGCNETVVK